MNTDKIIRDLYNAFSDIPQRIKVEGCTHCCASEAELFLLTKERKTADKNAVSTLAHNAMSTVGNDQDFLYFLPRIFEEILADYEFWELSIDSFFIRLKQAGYDTWSPDKRSPVDDFLPAIFQGLCQKGQMDEIVHWLASLCKCGFDLTSFLQILDDENHGDMKAEIINTYFARPARHGNKIRLCIFELSPAQYEPIRKWTSQSRVSN